MEGNSWGPSLRWESNIKVDRTEAEYKDLDLIGMVRDKLKCQTVVKEVINFHFPLKSGSNFFNL